MHSFLIQGGTPLHGTVRIRGSKNASLPLMAAALLTPEPVVLRNVPDLSDIRNMIRLLGSLGCEVAHDTGDDGDLTLHAADRGPTLAHYDIVRTMRAGVCVLGPLLASRGRARVSMPGGCAIGDRPVDLHIRGLRALGAEIELDGGYIDATTPRDGKGRLRGGHVFLGGPNGSTVLGTANVLSAATLAEGTTVIECAACEPEVEDLADLLNAMGARITGAGTPRITVQGVDALHGADHAVIPDRIEAGTYVIAAAMTRGDVVLEDFPTSMLSAFLDRLNEAGVTLERVPRRGGFSRRGGDPESTGAPESSPAPDTATEVAAPPPHPPRPAPHAPGLRDTVRILPPPPGELRPVHVVTQPHPGFPTDLQAQLMAMLCLARGNSIVTEKIFPDRFLHVAELSRMGADLVRSGPTVVVSGVAQLIGAPVMASDLRASAGLVLAGLAARGTTTIHRVYHLDRGYQRMELTLQSLGADIERIEVPKV